MAEYLRSILAENMVSYLFFNFTYFFTFNLHLENPSNTCKTFIKIEGVLFCSLLIFIILFKYWVLISNFDFVHTMIILFKYMRGNIYYLRNLGYLLTFDIFIKEIHSFYCISVTIIHYFIIMKKRGWGVGGGFPSLSFACKKYDFVLSDYQILYVIAFKLWFNFHFYVWIWLQDYKYLIWGSLMKLETL